MAKTPAYDSIYQNALRNFKRLSTSTWNTYNDTNTQNLLNRNLSNKPLIEEQPIRLQGIRDDASGRGMLFSSKFGENTTEYNTDLKNRKDAVARQYDQAKLNNDRQKSQTLDSILMQREQAKLDWIARRAAARNA